MDTPQKTLKIRHWCARPRTRKCIHVDTTDRKSVRVRLDAGIAAKLLRIRVSKNNKIPYLRTSSEPCRIVENSGGLLEIRIYVIISPPPPQRFPVLGTARRYIFNQRSRGFCGGASNGFDSTGNAA